MAKYRNALLLSFASLISAAQGQIAPQTVDRIVDEAKNRSQVMRHLTHLTTQIGPRLTGSANLETATQWAMAEFRKMGLKNVRYEPYGKMVGFDRGPNCYGKMVSPVARTFEFTSQAWSVGTQGPVRGLAVVAPTTMAELISSRKDLPGAWVVYPDAIGRGNPSPKQDPEVEKLLDEIGIAGRVIALQSERIQTGGRPQRPDPQDPKTPVVIIRGSDLAAIKDFLSLRIDVSLEFNLDHRFSKEDRPTGNVIAEIPGTTKPDEFVILSGHLDSWDGPGSQGCQDNGTGSSIVLEVARVLAKTGLKPQRTIRFVLWSGEEQGLLGSSGYVRDHASELDKISAVFVEDAGGGFDAGLSYTENMAPFFRPVFERIGKEFPQMVPQERIVLAMPTRSGGSDHAPFVAKGVPGFFWRKGGNLSYNLIWHTQYDRLEQVNPDYLVQASTCNALTVATVACAENQLPRN